MQQVGIFTATRWEFNAVRRAISVETRTRVAGSRCAIGRRGNAKLYLFQTGVGIVKAGAVCREAFASQPLDLAISSGFACALTSSHIGDLLIGTDVVLHRGTGLPSEVSKPVPCAEGVGASAISAAGVAARAGRFVTVRHVLCQASEKHVLAAETGAIGLDMESAAVGMVAAQHRVPFAIVRAVSDLLDEDLPLDLNLFLRPTGWPKGVLLCLAQPASLLGLNRLRKQSVLASDRLATFLGRFLDDLR
jgi:adenosylhomocysteine nucleosidase